MCDNSLIFYIYHNCSPPVNNRYDDITAAYLLLGRRKSDAHDPSDNRTGSSLSLKGTSSATQGEEGGLGVPLDSRLGAYKDRQRWGLSNSLFTRFPFEQLTPVAPEAET